MSVCRKFAAVTVLAVSTAQADTIYVDVNCSSDCCSVHSTPGCDDTLCEALVCAALPNCCIDFWDAFCVATATVVCDSLCIQPPNGTAALPYCSIQTAIDNAVDADEIVVAPGTYFETINFNGKAVWLHSSDGADVTVIDAGGGKGAGTVVTCVSSEGPATVLQGFTMTGGFFQCSDDDAPAGEARASGMLNIDSDPTVISCRFDGNISDAGAGMRNVRANPAVSDSSFVGNIAAPGDGSCGCITYAGGMLNIDSSPTVTNCTFTGNSADLGGGMYNNSNSSPTVIDCTFSDNSAGGYGGGMANNEPRGGCGDLQVVAGNAAANPTVINCTFTGNTAAFGGGGGMSMFESSPTVTNCAFIGNTADSERRRHVQRR